jgi:hypothetical protein
MSEPRIIYILIGKEKTPLVGYSEHTGDFIQTCEAMLDKVTKDSSAAVNLGTGFTIFYTNENDITYLIMANSLYPKSTAIGCIESIKNEFQSTFRGRDFDSEQEYGLNDDFKEKLKMKYEYYNENTEVSSEAIQNLKAEMLRMRDEVLEASGLLNQTNEALNIMTSKAETLAQDSESHKKQAVQVKKKENWKKICFWIAIAVIILLIVYFIICGICGSFTFNCSSD